MNWANASCQGVDPAIFQEDEPGYNESEAKRVCGSCPLINVCADYVFRVEPIHDRHGVWAGSTPKERTREHRRRQRPRKNPALAAEDHARRLELWTAGLNDAAIGISVGAGAYGVRNWRRRNRLIAPGQPGYHEQVTAMRQRVSA